MQAVNLSVTKENLNILTLDLSSEIEANGGGDLSFFIGRDEKCHVHLDDMRVSREHAKLKYQNQKWHIEQCAELNNVSLNGVSCSTSILKSGDLVTIGPFTLSITGEVGVNSAEAFLESEPIIETIHEEEVTELLEQPVESDELEDENELSIGLGEEATEFHSSTEEEEEFAEESPVEDENEFDSFVSEDEEDVDDNFEMDTYEDDDESTKVLQGFSTFYLEIFGEHAPYDKYEIKDKSTYIGRDPEKCQIVLGDAEVSSVHALITKKAINCSLEDQKSGNGTLLNGERVNQSDLKNGDEIIIGSTTFTVRVSSSFLEEEKNRIMPVEENQFVEVEEIVEVGEDEAGDLAISTGGTVGELGAPESNSLFSKDALKDPDKRKKLLYILVGLLALWIMLDDGSKKPKKPIKKKKETVVKSEKVLSKTQKPLTPEEREIVDAHYILVTQYYSDGQFSRAIMEADKVYAITTSYKNLNQYVALAKEGVKKLEALEKERRDKERERIRKIKIKSLIIKAEDSIEKKKMDLAEGLIDEIISLDPNNDEVHRMRREIEHYRKEKERIAVEKAQKIAERKRQVQDLSPGKTFFLQREWFKAIAKLSDFLRSKSIDEDLRKEASEMLNTSKRNLRNKVGPLLGKARSLREGQDMKGSYETYLEILNIEPSHTEALNEMNDIREKLELKSKKIYREAIISESLSLYTDAKEKFQEVQQVSPTDSEYYKKATEKLKEYLD
jgi:pSer/pThr/pTyr-binding forkhead associated (FHA) protein